MSDRPTSVNFAFLASHDAVLAEYAAEAEGVFREHPRLCISNLRTLAEALARHAAAYSGVQGTRRTLPPLWGGRLAFRGVTSHRVGSGAAHIGAPRIRDGQSERQRLTSGRPESGTAKVSASGSHRGAPNQGRPK